MDPLLELNLALILFLPWYLLLGGLFWRMHAHGRNVARKLLVLVFLLLALVAAGLTGVWAYGYADISTGPIWRQILACVVGYAAFLGVLTTGFVALRLPVFGFGCEGQLQSSSIGTRLPPGEG